MEIITLPSCPPIVGVGWRYSAPSQLNRSEWTGKSKVTANPIAPTWLAEVRPFEIIDEEDAWAWNAFFGKLQGRVNAFRLPAVVKAQITGLTILVKGSGQTGFSLLTDGWGTTGLKAGQFVTIADQLMRLTEHAVPSGGECELTFDRWLWSSPADNAVVTVDRPTALMRMAEDITSIDDNTAPSDPDGEGDWTVGFNCEEAR